MASLKDVKVKIGGVKKTKQITKAMNMVASAKLRGAQQRIERFRPYAEKFYEVLQDLADKTDQTSHPLLAARDEVKKTGILLVTSDRGLCGSFNLNIIMKALKLAEQKKAEGKQIVFYCIGKKGRDAIVKTETAVLKQIVGAMGHFDFQLASSVGEDIIDAFLREDLDEVLLVYGQFVSLARQTPTVLPLLPVTPELSEAGGVSDGKEYIYEPAVDALLGELLPRFIKVQVYRGLLDTSASEHAARMTAMDNATKNCDDMAASLTLLFNKTRQAAITRDLMDIVGGAEALNG